jgi:YbbR domain-containing protein
MLKRMTDAFQRDWTLKAVAFALSFVLWLSVKWETISIRTLSDVNVRVVVGDNDWIMTEPPAPRSVRVVFSGPWRELAQLSAHRSEVVIGVEQVRDTLEQLSIRPSMVSLPAGLSETRVDEIFPSSVTLEFDRVHTRLLPLAVTVTSVPPAGLELAGPIRLDPPVVRVSGPQRRVERLDSLRLPPLDLGTVRFNDTISLAIDTTGLGVLVSPRTIRAIVPLRPVGTGLMQSPLLVPGMPGGL